MVSKDVKNYKGFDKNLTKEDLNEEELECYNKLMEGIEIASGNKKEEVRHLMEVFIEADEDTRTSCARCGVEFNDDYEDLNPKNKRIYCNKCLDKMWGHRG